MARNGAMDSEVDAPREPLVPQEPDGKLRGTRGIRSLGGDPARRVGFKQKRGRRDCGTKPAEAPAKIASEVEHAEVQSSRGFDEDATGIGHTQSAGPSPPVPGAPRS